ncbi:MAG TPA: zinc metalloprotease HtpX [Acidimicrobiales bacterium]|nr:zinc metalloprotease HtpX [Acidimicrobiales bacterium]
MSRNTFKTYTLLSVLGVLFILIGAGIGGGTGIGVAFGAGIGLVIGLVVTGVSYWKSDALAIRAAGAVAVSEQQMPQYYQVVRQLTQRDGLPMPRLYVSGSMQPNAFATGRNPEHAAVCCTQGILQVLDWDELTGVLAHELSHVKNRDILIGSVAAAVAMGITFIARIAMWGAMFGANEEGGEGGMLGVLAMAILAPIAAMMLQLALTRSREFEADRSGARLLGSGEPLARALEKIERGVRTTPMNVAPAAASMFIVNPLAGRRTNFANLFNDHPPTAERIARLRSGEWQHF